MKYDEARDRLRSIVGNALLNSDDEGSVMLLYPMTVADFERGGQPLLGVISDGDLAVLAGHQCTVLTGRPIRVSSEVIGDETWTPAQDDPMTALRAEVEALRDEAKTEAMPLFDIPDLADQVEHLGGRYVAYSRVLDLIDKLRQAVDRLERERDELRRAVEDRRDRTAARPDLFGDQAYAYSAVLDMLTSTRSPTRNATESTPPLPAAVQQEGEAH